MENRTYSWGVGKRKSAVARVKLHFSGDGTITVNGKDAEQFFTSLEHRSLIHSPFVVTDTLGKFSAEVKVEGGGVSGQAGAVRHGISRALAGMNEQFRLTLRRQGLLTRDPRTKERKKYGLKRARKAPQYTKR
ncbi:MAG: 30S ribosomal protein S9 [Chloroflexota bacterium]